MQRVTANRETEYTGNGHHGSVGTVVEYFVDNGPSVGSERDYGAQGDRAYVDDFANYEDERRGVMVEEGDMVEEVRDEDGGSTGKRKGRKALVGLVLFLVIIGAVIAAYWFMVGGGATKKAKVPVKNSANSNSGVQTEDELTKSALREATGPGVALGDGTVVRPQGESGQTADVSGKAPITQTGPVISPTLSGTIEGAQTQVSLGGVNGPAVSPGAGVQVAAAVTAPARNEERSVRIGEMGSTSGGPGASAPRRSSEDRNTRVSPEKNVGADGVVVPSFGSMLPVRSLGVLFTLRSGSLARFELTRDIKGKGWSMQRGTVLVGAMRGSEIDRAFVSLVGFIDPESGKFVRVSGDLLGSDGAAGMRGKKRKVSGGWSRVLGKIGEAGLNIATSLAGSLARRPVVIADAYGASGAKVTNELDGVLLGRGRNSFVEVSAGSVGYMMITQLPDAIEGVDALAQLSGRDLEERSDPGRPRRTTGLSERELADLIQSGDAQSIRAELSRMTPEMRRVAEAVLQEDGGE